MAKVVELEYRAISLSLHLHFFFHVLCFDSIWTLPIEMSSTVDLVIHADPFTPFVPAFHSPKWFAISSPSFHSADFLIRQRCSCTLLAASCHLLERGKISHPPGITIAVNKLLGKFYFIFFKSFKAKYKLQTFAWFKKWIFLLLINFVKCTLRNNAGCTICFTLSIQF